MSLCSVTGPMLGARRQTDGPWAFPGSESKPEVFLEEEVFGCIRRISEIAEEGVLNRRQRLGRGRWSGQQ